MFVSGRGGRQRTRPAAPRRHQPGSARAQQRLGRCSRCHDPGKSASLRFADDSLSGLGADGGPDGTASGTGAVAQFDADTATAAAVHDRGRQPGCCSRWARQDLGRELWWTDGDARRHAPGERTSCPAPATATRRRSAPGTTTCSGSWHRCLGSRWITDGSPAGTWQIMSGLTAVSAGAALGNAFYFWTDRRAGGAVAHRRHRRRHQLRAAFPSRSARSRRSASGCCSAPRSVGGPRAVGQRRHPAGTVLLKDILPGPLSGGRCRPSSGRRRPGVLVGARRCQRLRAVGQRRHPGRHAPGEGHLARPPAPARATSRWSAGPCSSAPTTATGNEPWRSDGSAAAR